MSLLEFFLLLVSIGTEARCIDWQPYDDLPEDKEIDGWMV